MRDREARDIVVTANDSATNNTVVEMAPCADGRLELYAGIGSHDLVVKAMGTLGDVADSVSIDGAIPQDGATTMLPPLTLMPTPPLSEIVAEVDTKSYCGVYPSSNLLVEVMSGGQVYSASADCYSSYSIFVKNVPYGALTVTAKLRNNSNNAILKTSPSMSVAPKRGQSSVELVLP